jgi:hypothetical protein
MAYSKIGWRAKIEKNAKELKQNPGIAEECFLLS